MEFTEKDLKKKLKPELVEIASKREGYNAKIHKKKEDLIAFLLKKEIVRKVSKKDALLEKASRFADFRKSIHGTSIAKLEAFLAKKEKVATSEDVVVVEEQDKYAAMSMKELREEAKKHGWPKSKRTGTRVELTEFIKIKVSGGGAAPTEKVAVAVKEEMEEWPVDPSVLQKHSKTVDDLKNLLKAKGIAVGLPRTRKEILELFQHSRCSFKDFTCSDTEFCDLRNNLCRTLNILRNKDNEIKKFAKGLVYIDEEKGRFYGTPDAIAKVRQALLHPEEIVIEPVVQQKEVVKEKVVVEQPEQIVQKQVQEQEEEEQGISPININKLLDKPSENEIRRAILHCLGLYHDIDPNDEIILSSSS